MTLAMVKKENQEVKMDRDSREENQQKIVEKHQEHDVSKGVRTSRKIEGYKYRREK